MKRKYTRFKNPEGYIGIVYWYSLRLFNKEFDFWYKVKMVRGIAAADPISQVEKDRINATFDRRENSDLQ